eukprot:TRINITY_DN521_c1_g1_i13.p4 TRINITY_DN521_c1_g1~~TRINITY_DN521_c1_g1_i13.p4  ORF type:complete len:106 (+),score=17.59 TRINITY_DN521_c1_g1_i13:692-1009(+)
MQHQLDGFTTALALKDVLCHISDAAEREKQASKTAPPAVRSRFSPTHTPAPLEWICTLHHVPGHLYNLPGPLQDSGPATCASLLRLAEMPTKSLGSSPTCRPPSA